MSPNIFLKLAAILALSGLTEISYAQPFLFDDVSTVAGVNVVHEGPVGLNNLLIGTGAVWFDYDNDGDLDLFMTIRSSGVGNYLFENDGTGNFTDVAVLRGVDEAAHDAAGASAVDYDNDGDDDLYLANSDDDVLLRNNLIETGTPDFTDVTATAFPLEPVPFLDARGQSASWGDYDNDGFVDLYVSNHVLVGGDRNDYTLDSQDRFFHNNGDGTFTNVSDLIRGVDDANGNDDLDGYGFIAGWTDFDNDGDMDIFMTNDCPYGPRGNKLWRNDGGTDPLNWNFTEIMDATGLAFGSTCVNSMGLAMGDYNRDGLWDYFYTDIGTATLIQNDGGGLFSDVTVNAGLFSNVVPGSNPPKNRVSWGTVFFDYDLDGFQDLAVAAGTLGPVISDNPQPNMLYHNNGDGTFTDQSSTAWTTDTRRGRTISMGDYDADGDPDLFLVNYNQAAVLLNNNEASGNNWLQVLLEGTLSNRDGIGAKVHVTDTQGVTQHYEVRSGSNLGGGDDRAAYFGFGDVSSDPFVDLQIDWPSGRLQAVSGVPVDQRITITEAVTDLGISIAPIGGPIVIPGGGGSFEYDLNVTNNTISTKDFDVWINISGPGISITRGPVSTTQAAGMSLLKTLSQNVPGGAQAGTYTITGNAGSFPIADVTDSFTFDKTAAAGSASLVHDWNSSLGERVVGIQTKSNPEEFELAPNFPNPFYGTTVISYTLPEPQSVTLSVFDILGREVAHRQNGTQAAGRHRLTFDATSLGAGLYIYVLKAGPYRTQRQMLVLR